MDKKIDGITVYLPKSKRSLLLTIGDVGAVILGTCLTILCATNLVGDIKARRSDAAKVE